MRRRHRTKFSLRARIEIRGVPANFKTRALNRNDAVGTGSATVPVAIGWRPADRFRRVDSPLFGVSAGVGGFLRPGPKAAGATPALPKTNYIVPAEKGVEADKKIVIISFDRERPKS